MLQNAVQLKYSRNLCNILIVLAIFLFVSGCVFSSGSGGGKIENQPTTTTKDDTPQTENSPVSANKKEDKGDFKIEKAKLKNQKYSEIDRKVKEEKLLENAAEELNKALSLPNDIFVVAQDCGEANAQFDPNDQTITICYELMERFYKLYLLDGMSQAEADAKMFDAIRFVFLHEVGHALIFNYKLPIMGNEEDAADRCSSYINIKEVGEKGVKAVLAAADAFRIESRQDTPTKRDMADEHLLQEQRFYNSLCMIYGSNSSKYEYFVKDGYLPRERAVRCPQEYKKTVDSWVNLLGPWRKNK